MKTRLLIFSFLLVAGILNAQDTIKTLVISEARLDAAHFAYVELSNVGTTPLNLADFEFGTINPWTVPYNAGTNLWFMLPEKTLDPGKSFVIAKIDEYNPEMWPTNQEKYSKNISQPEMAKLADIQLHFPESSPAGAPTDSVSPNYQVLQIWNGSYCYYVRHHLSNGDSVVIDQVNGIFSDADGTAPDAVNDIAGVTAASNNSILVRKFSVKKGNLDFSSGKGLDLTDSEWMPIARLSDGGWDAGRAVYWTVGNHGDYNLDEATVTSNTIDIDLANATLTVPWGVRHDDSIMYQFDRRPGIAWDYDYSPNFDDSAYISVRTGDILTMYACGNNLDKIVFDITVAPPTAGANIVVPKIPKNFFGTYRGQGAFCEVSDKIPGMDTISEFPYATRVDTLFKYLEKAPKASWEIIWVDGNERVDLKRGDILKVTAENGAVKQYYIKVREWRPSHDAYMGSITWPDIPEFYKDLYGWNGDTIPNYIRTKFDYKVSVPYDVDGIPALIAKTGDVNANLEVDRAKNLNGSDADKTVKFTVTAEDDTTIFVYNIQMEKEKDYANIQPWLGEPFISQVVWWQDYGNHFIEVVNPGTEPLDMSHYMLTFNNATNPADGITGNSGVGDWGNRYTKYIPGRKWQSQGDWEITPVIAVEDLNVNPIVQPGDVFVVGQTHSSPSGAGYPTFMMNQVDIDFAHSPWIETVGAWSNMYQWSGTKYMLWKILNDSIINGTKAATDPNDFELLDLFGSAGDWKYNGGGIGDPSAFTRRPQYYKGNPEIGGSLGTTTENSEWERINEAILGTRNYGWPGTRVFVADGIGSHTMNAATIYKSTISSSVYKVSEGFGMEEEIKGVVDGTTVSEFLANLIKANEGQMLEVHGSAGSLELTAVVSNTDTLIVVSADTVNISKYILNVTAGGLSDDAVIVSTEYTVDVNGANGTISGMDYMVTLRDVMAALTMPDGSSFTLIDANDAYVSYSILNYDTTLVDVKISAEFFIEVVAENNTTTIVYQFVPDLMNNGAFLTSSVFEVDQTLSLINNVPSGISVGGLMKYLIPAPGASIMILDKMGFERTLGDVYYDDKIIVTAEDGTTTKIYYMQVLGPLPSYLAYVTSTVFNVNQVELTITGEGIDILMDVSAFLADLNLAENATMVVTNAAGTPHTGKLAVGDLVVVTAGDGVTTKTYAVTVGNSIKNANSEVINVYPNPSTGTIYVSGLEIGNRVYVSNMLGQRVIDRVVMQKTEMISLAGQSSGIYFVTVKNGENVVGRYKLILQ